MKKARNVFHVSQLKLHILLQVGSGPVPTNIDPEGNENDAVRTILDKKRMGRKVYFLFSSFSIRSLGYPESKVVLMHELQLSHCPELISLYERNHPISSG